MVTMDQIQALSKEIVTVFHPEQIILFGSYAYGTPDPESDVDLLVVLPCSDDVVRKALDIRSHITPKFPVDLIVRTPDQVQRRLALNDWFLRKIIEQGRVLYAVHSPD